MVERGRYDWVSPENLKIVQRLKTYDADTRECIKILIHMKIAEELQDMNRKATKK